MDTNEIQESARVDELLARTKVLEPARGVTKLTPEQLSSLSVSAKHWEDCGDEVRGHRKARPPRRRWGYVTAGSLVAAGALAATVLLSIGSAGPLGTGDRPGGIRNSLPSPIVKLGRQPRGYPSLASYVYKFTAGSGLPSSSGTGTAYQLSTASDVQSLAGQVESALGISGPVANEPGDYLAGPSGGPDVTVGLEHGVVQWHYPTWVDQSPGLSIPVIQGSPVPTDDQATASAEQVLQSMGIDQGQLGSPQVARSSSAVGVTYPVMVDGLPTGIYDQIMFGPGGVITTASGMIAAATPSASYPTISATQAVALLTESSLTSASGITTEDGSDVVTVGIDGATPVLSTYVLADGTSWLLPTLRLSGTETGSSGSIVSGEVLAVQSQYVQLEH